MIERESRVVKLKGNLRNSTIFVIGGSSGIGRGIADALVQHGAVVVVFSRTAPIGLFSDKLRWRELDLSNLEQSRIRLTAAIEEFGEELDAVFYSAIDYGSKRTLFLNVQESEWLRQTSVNLHGLWLTLSLTLPVLNRRSSGLFVHISSEVVYNAGPGRSGYAATKAAASSLMRSLAQEDPEGTVRLVELLPSKMVDTAGIRKRRPNGFDYSDYMTSDAFSKIVRQLLENHGENMHGQSWIVDAKGEWKQVSEVKPDSQSKLFDQVRG